MGCSKFCTPLLAKLEQLSNLTHLSLTCGVWSSEKTELVQLSRLVNLQHLKLTMEICGECPCNVLSQLGKLTCLDVSRPSEDLQQLSTLTALQQLCLKDVRVASGGLLLQQLPQLTSLKMTACNVGHGTGSIFRCLQPTSPGPTALQSLALCDCAVEPGALACATQLRALSLKNERDPQGTEFENQKDYYYLLLTYWWPLVSCHCSPRCPSRQESGCLGHHQKDSQPSQPAPTCVP
jgi:hypothetical protein